MATTPEQRFPSDPILVKLLQAAQSTSHVGPIVYDASGFEKTYGELLGDILQMRNLIKQSLPSSLLAANGMLNEKTPYISVLTISGYEFLVAFFAIRALGGACVPLGSGILPEEAGHYLSITTSACLLFGKGRMEQANSIATYIGEARDQHITALPIISDTNDINCASVGIDETTILDPRGPGMILFTSGTTGRPKGAVLPRECSAFQHMADPRSGSINYRPAHWIGGAETLIKAVITGTKLHVTKEMAGAGDVWEIVKGHRITDILFTPNLLRTMKDHYNEHIATLSEEERHRYVESFKNLSQIRSCSAMIAPAILDFWTSLTGLPFQNVYGSTELGGAALQTSIGSNTTYSIGRPYTGIKVKLSEGDRGELLVKSPWMLTHYVGKEDATSAAFDELGYFRTGDLAELVEGEYIFMGRATTDYVFFNSYRIPCLRVESSLMSLPYISEAYVVGVPDHEANEICGMVVRLRSDFSAESDISLTRIRSDLLEQLPAYMLPGLLRKLDPEEQVPRTVSGKAIRKGILKEFFGVTDYWSFENPAPKVESYGRMPQPEPGKAKAWDWCGMQRAI